MIIEHGVEKLVSKEHLNTKSKEVTYKIMTKKYDEFNSVTYKQLKNKQQRKIERKKNEFKPLE
jgi:HKD family nuclease